MTKRIFALILAILLALTGLALAEGSKEEGKTIDKDYTKDQAVSDTGIATTDLSDQLGEETAGDNWVNEDLTGELEYWTWDNAAPYYAEAFTKHYPNVKVTVNVVPDYWTKMKQVLATGAGLPDAAMIEANYYQEAANSYLFEDLNAQPYNAEAIRGKYIEFWWDSGIGEDGVQRVVPNSPGMAGCFYRRDLVEQLLGYDDPEQVGQALSDWDKVYELGVQLRDMSEGKKFIITTVNDMATLMRLQSGKTYVMEGKLDLSFLRPIWETCLKFRNEGLDAKYSEWTPEGAAMMKNGDVLMYNSGSWFESYCIVANCGTETDGLWGVTTMPVKNVSSGGNGFAIPTGAENKELGWEFIKFSITDPTMQADQLKRFSCYPALIEAQNDPYFDLDVPLFKNQKARKFFGEIAQSIDVPARQKDDDGISTIVNKYFDDMILGNIDIDTALSEAENEIRSIYMDFE